MDVDVRDHGRSRYTVHVSLSSDEVKGAFDRTYQQLSDRGGVRGFRPGKVPREILDRHYDYDAIRAGTYDTLVQDRLQRALEENDLNPIDQIQIEVGAPPDDDEALAETIKSGLVTEEVDESQVAEEGDDADLHDEHECGEDCDHDHEEDIPLVEGEPFDFYTTFTAYPRPELPDLSDLKLRRPVAEVTDEDVDARIEQIRQVSAEEVEVDRDTIEEGDLVVADVKIVLEGEDEDEAKSSEQEITIGSRDYIGDLDDALVGQKAGDTVEVEYQYPDDHPDEELAGTPARIIAEISSFSGRQVPELDDEFAQSLGNYDSIDELRAALREQLEAEANRRSEQELHAQVLGHIVDNTRIDLPEEFVERAVQRSRDDLMSELQGMGMSMEEFVEASNLDEEGLAERQEREAVNTLTLHFATEALARERGIELTEDDMVQELQRIADEGGGDMAMVQQAAALQQGFGEEVRERATRRKLIADIVASAEIEEVSLEDYRSEMEAAREAEAPAAETEDPAAVESDEEAESPASNPSDEPAGDEDVQESESQ